MANINLTPGERYTFGKLKGISVITDSSDYAQTPKYIRNTLIITASGASIIQINDYGTADPYLRLSKGVSTEDNWSVGIDNSDGGSFKINNSGVLSVGASMALRIDTDENILMPGDVGISGSFALGGIANAATAYGLYYNTTTKQVTYGASGSGGGGSTSPGGSDTQIQYNSAGVFGGVPTLTWDGTTLRATGSFTGSLIGALTGTASYATQALSASFVSNAASASYAATSSYSTTLGASLFQPSAGVLILLNSAGNTLTNLPTLSAASANTSTTADSASKILIQNTPATTGTYYPVFVSNITGYGQARIDNSTFTYDTTTNTLTVTASYATTASYVLNTVSASYADNGGVTQLLAGPNITLSPTNGLGQVTVSATLSGSTIFNTATGSYGSFYDTTTQTNPVANVARSMSFNSTDITNGVSISGSTSPFNTYIKTQNAGVYDIQFSAQIDKTDSGTDEIVIWLRKNGTDLTDSATTLTLSGNNDKQVAAWNWFVTSAAGDYYQIIWRSLDTDLRLLAEPISGTHPGIPSVILTVNRVDQFLSNTGSFSGSFTGAFTGSFSGSGTIATSSFALTASYAANATSASYAATASYYPSAITPSGGEGTVQFQNGSGIAGNTRFTYDNSNNIVNINNGARLNATGSLQGTASVAISALTTRTNTSATFYPVFVDSANGVAAAETLWTPTSNITMNPGVGSISATSITSSLFGTASYATVAQTLLGSVTSASFSATASYVNILNQHVIVTGSMVIGSSSLGPFENTLTLGARDAVNEGGQIGFNAPGGTYTSASFIDNWQNKARILKGNNTTSTGLIAQWDIHTTQMQLPGYTAASSFPGTAAANLAVDSGGNVITVSTTGGTVFPYTGNAVITGSLTTTGIIYAQPNGGMYFQGGDDAALYDINISNHMGIYGVQDATVSSIKLGSGGGIISGKSGNIGIGTTTPSASLHISGASSAALLEIDSPAVNNILYVSGSGNVGIGTNTPTVALDVTSTIAEISKLTTNQTSGYTSYYEGATQRARIGFGASIFSSTPSAANVGIRSEGGINLGTGGNNIRMVIDSTGNIGMGITSLTARLGIRGSGATSATTALRVENTNASASLVVLDNGSVYSFGPKFINSNTTFGALAHTNLDSGSNNTAFGVNAGNAITNGLGNTSIGPNANRIITTGEYNIAIGYNTIYSNISGSNNIAIGQSALFNSTGTTNVAIGSSTAYSTTIGVSNSALGHASLYSNTVGSGNVSMGYASLFNLNTGSNNVAIGYDAGRFASGSSTPLSSSSDSVFIGLGARANANGETNQIVIGSGALGIGSNSVVLGNNSITRTALKGSVGIGTTTPSASLHISGASSAALLEIDSPAVNNIMFVSGSGNIGFNQTSSTSQVTFKGVGGSTYTSEINTISNGAYGFRTDGPTKSTAYFFTNSTGNINSNTGTSILYFDASNNVGLNVSSSLTSKFQVRGSGATSATTALRVENTNASASLAVLDNGYVGIGTSSPSNSLTIKTGVNDDGILLESSAGNPLFLVRKDGTSNNTAELFQYGSGAIRLAIRSITNFSYFNGGNFGFGTTTDVGYRLTISGSSTSGSLNVNNTLYVSGSSVGIGTTTPSASLHISGASSTNLLRIDSPASSSIVYVSGNGNVGIGTNSPAYRLDVAGAAYFASPVHIGSVLNALVTGTGVLYIGNSKLAVSSTTGNVIIQNGGTFTDAGYRLDVQGTTRINGNTNITGSLIVTAGITGSLLGTASYATQALSASWAPGGSGASFPYTGSAGITGSLNVTGSFIAGDYGIVSIDSSNRITVDGSGMTSIDYGTRTLTDSAGPTTLNWDASANGYAVEVPRSYFKSTPNYAAQENFSAGVFNAEGRILQGVSFNGASDYDFVYLDNAAGEWKQVDNVSSRASKMLGIAFGIGSTDSVLLEGHVTITNTPGTYSIPAVDTIAHGLPIYVSSSAFATTTPPISTGEYVRILGHAYYQNSGDPDVWVMNFRPDHTWVEL